MIIKEVCLENNINLEKAIQLGADRIELCDNLAEGGTSVSYGVAKYVTKLCHANHVKVMAMVRPRKGNFVYNDIEINMMLDDISTFKEIGVDGVVFGSLTKNGEIDKPTTLQLVESSKGLEVTFHMAFDDLNEKEKLPAIDWLSEIGVKRILTHGGSLDQPIEDNLNTLRKYVDYASNRIIILPGGGITNQNIETIIHHTGAVEAHGTKVLGAL